MHSYSLITLPIAALLITQTIKLLTDKVEGNFTWKHLIHDYGGMPSSHSAFVSALVAEIAIWEGINSPIFAVSLIFAILIIRDALGLRNYLSKANKEINKLNKKARLNERLGHTYAQVIVGCLIGVLIALIGIVL